MPGLLAFTSPIETKTPLPSTASVQLAFASTYKVPASCIIFALPFKVISGAVSSTSVASELINFVTSKILLTSIAFNARL